MKTCINRNPSDQFVSGMIVFGNSTHAARKKQKTLGKKKRKRARKARLLGAAPPELIYSSRSTRALESGLAFALRIESLPTSSYQSRRFSQLQVDPPTMVNGKSVRHARFQPEFGEQDYRVGVLSRTILFTNFLVPADSIDLGLDDNVHAEYGAKLFPRAIGYSAGLIDFFRGQIDAADKPLDYGLSATRPTSVDIPGIKILFPDDQQTGSGTIRLVLLHYHTFKGTDPGPFSPGPHPAVVVSDEVPFEMGLIHKM